MTADEKFDALLEGLGDLRAEMAGLSAWIKSDRERADRLEASLINLRTVHSEDLQRVYSKVEGYATRKELAALEERMVARQRWIVGMLVTILIAIIGSVISIAPHLIGL